MSITSFNVMAVSWARRLAHLATGLLAAALLTLQPQAVQAQEFLDTPPPVRSPTDANGADVSSGAYTLSVAEVTIGQPGAGGLAYQRSFIGTGWRDNFTGTINKTGSVYTVSLGGGSETFTLAAGVYGSDQMRGSTLTFNSVALTYSYTTADGTVAVFSKAFAGTTPTDANEGRLTSITYPTGEIVTLTYSSGTVGSLIARVQSVNNNLGYQLKFTYASNTLVGAGDIPNWTKLTKVTGINNATDYCDPIADTCAGLPSTLPSITYATAGDDPMARTATDQIGRVTRYTYDGAGRITRVRRPSSATDNIILTYNGSNLLASLSNGSATWTYSYADAGASRYTTVTDPFSKQRQLYSQAGLVISDTDPLNHTTTYAYDTFGRRTRVTAPEGNYVENTYDARGNVTLTTQVAKSGSGLSNVTTSAVFPSSCSNAKTCNKPTTTTDERGKTTNYTYSSTHGSLATVTAPPPDTDPGTVRPQTRYTYTALSAWYKNSTGAVAQAPSSVYRLTNVSACATTTSCNGTADEVETILAYGPVNVANNLLPVTMTSRAGNASLTATTTTTYSNAGDLLTIDGPLTGTTDTTRYRYDDARQLVGVVGPEPDAAGSLKHRAMKITYNFDGRPTLIERGTVNSQSDTDWAAFTMLEQKTAAYDALGREIKNTLAAGGSPLAVVQYSYDAANRLECTGLRMNPAVFASLPASACTMGTTGSNGPDRITRNTYDAAGQLTKMTEGYASASERDAAMVTYSSNGRRTTLADDKGNLTTYEYDGFDRVKKIRYPSPTTAGASSTTDYEQYTYDAASNVTQDRRRDGTAVNFTYDALNRATVGLLGTTYAYDNLNRPTSTLLSSQTTTYAWDALSRLTSETGALGAVAYQYDLTGQRTRLTWPGGGFYVTYDYDTAGDLTAIRENGAASGIGVLATYAFDNLGRRTSLTRGNGVVTSYGYDAASRLTSLAQDLASTTNDVTFGFTYNAASQALTRSSTNAAYNPPAPSNGTTAYTSNGLNQHTVAAGTTLTYDTRGNLSNDGAKSYAYDIANRLTSVTGATLTYDAAGRLIQTAGSATTKFLYDGAAMIAEYSSGGTVLRRYVHGPGSDEPLVWYEGTGTTDRRWLVADQLGSVIGITNDAGASTTTNTYDEYGQPGLSNIGRFQYTGQIWLPEVELYHYKARAYSPELGRFLQTDPIGYGDGMNMYAYVGNDPVNRTDPWGLQDAPTDVSEVVITASRNTGSISGFFGDGLGYLGNVKPDNPHFREDTLVDELLVLASKKEKKEKPPTPHHYEFSIFTQCSADQAFEVVRAPGNSAPGAPYARSGAHDLILTGNNPITQIVDPASRTITNITGRGHAFYPGTVQIRISDLGNGYSSIDITGKGTGDAPGLNVLMGGLLFGKMGYSVASYCAAANGASSLKN